MFENGFGVAKDPVNAVTWYRKAAAAGVDHGMFSLGNAYLKGNGVEKDRAEAVNWYRKAAAAGHQAAKKKLEELGEKQ